MIDIPTFTTLFLEKLSKTFRQRLFFVGLQGSYGRGEATETSDIDLVVILDELFASDIQVYNAMLDEIPNRELICGFLCGREELFRWEPSDLFQFYYDTKPLLGTLDELLPLLDGETVERAIKIGACNIYHGCIHNMLYEKSEEILKGLYKSACFVIQAIIFRKTGKYVSKHSELLGKADSIDRTIVETFLAIKEGEKTDFDKLSVALFDWAKERI